MRLLGVLPSWAAALACWTLVAVLQLPSNAVRRLQSESRDMRGKNMQSCRHGRECSWPFGRGRYSVADEALV